MLSAHVDSLHTLRRVLLVCVAIFCGLATVVVSSNAAAETDDESIRRAFSEYRDSVLARNGEAALSLVSSETLGYYDAILQLALYAPREIVRQANIGDRMLILMVRHRVKHEKLLKMNGAELFRHAVDSGWIGKNGVERLKVGSVAVRGDTARIVMVNRGQPTPIHITMRRETTWRVDLTSIHPVTNKAFGDAVARLGMSENAFIMVTLDTLSQRSVPDSVWDPIVR